MKPGRVPRPFSRRAPNSEVFVHPFQNSYFPYVGGQLKDIFEELKGLLEPDLILTHARDDLHQDHRLTCELTWNTWRDHLIFEYEIPKYDGDLGNPNVFVPDLGGSRPGEGATHSGRVSEPG